MSRAHAAATFLSVLFFACAAFPQEAEYFARIVTEGNATETHAVGAIAFRYDAEIERGSNAAETSVMLVNLRNTLRKAIQDGRVETLSIEDKPISFRPKESVAGWSTWVRFPPPTVSGTDDPGEVLGRLVRRARDLGTTAGCRVAGPYFEAEDAEFAEQETLARATENALYRAEGIARILRTRIYTVDSVEIVGVTWLNEGTLQPEAGDSPPSINGVTCRAEVRVTYLATPL
jgi:uncharacterized protein YggE